MPDLISILDLIRKQSAINALVEEANQDGAYGYVDAKSIVDILTGLPIVDAAEVVRCKDCKHSDTVPVCGEHYSFPLKCCLSVRYGGVFEDWFCEHGERR